MTHSLCALGFFYRFLLLDLYELNDNRINLHIIWHDCAIFRPNRNVMSRILTPHTINGITQDMAIQSNHKKFPQSNRLISMLF